MSVKWGAGDKATDWGGGIFFSGRRGEDFAGGKGFLRSFFDGKKIPRVRDNGHALRKSFFDGVA